MVYTANTPQGNQQIAATQGPINANFQFLASAIGQEHNFNAADPTLTNHLQASMPNQADPVALPPGTNGIYYVKQGQPKFFGTVANTIVTSKINSTIQSNGPLTFNSITPTSIITVPPYSCGSIWLVSTVDVSKYFVGTFISDSTTVKVFGDHSSSLLVQGVGLTIMAITSGGTLAYTPVILLNIT
jgi:hypothetical protein